MLILKKTVTPVSYWKNMTHVSLNPVFCGTCDREGTKLSCLMKTTYYMPSSEFDCNSFLSAAYEEASIDRL